MEKRRIIIGISGASGFVYGYTALRLLREAGGVETHLVISKGAEQTRHLETDIAREDVLALADKAYHAGDLGAPIASGSFAAHGMLVAPAPCGRSLPSHTPCPTTC